MSEEVGRFLESEVRVSPSRRALGFVVKAGVVP